MKKLVTFLLFNLFLVAVHAQETVSTLQASYSGKTSWDETSGTLTFTSTGKINITAKSGGTNLSTACRENFWNVPTSVKKIVINANVTVTGAFQFNGTCTVEGKDRYTSVVYGTPLQAWADKNNPKGLNLNEWYYCQFQNENKGGTLTINNLTCKNPFSFHVRAWDVKATITNCDFIDDRDGFGNHSDGIEAGDGSLIENCFFESGDDIFKVYFDNTIRNCTINMVTNTVPIQLGWGNYSDGAVGTFENLTITGSAGRGSDGNAIIAASYSGSPAYSVTVNLKDCNIQNPNASWVSMQGSNKLKGTVTNSKINVKQFWNPTRKSGTSEMKICGVQTGANTTLGEFDCRSTSNITTRFEAESYSSMSDIQKETTSDTGGGQNVAYIDNNDWCDYSFNVKTAGTYSTKFRVASGQNGGTIQVLKGTTVLGSVNVATTGGWQTWTTINGPNINLSSTGTQTIRLKFVNTSTTGFLYNLNWFEVTGAGAAKSAQLTTEELGEASKPFDIYPNPADGQFIIDLSSAKESSLIEVYNMQGLLVYSQIAEPTRHEVGGGDWKSGIYFVKVNIGGITVVRKLVVK